MTSEKKVELRVSTWLAVIAEMGRQDSKEKGRQIRDMVESMEEIEVSLTMSPKSVTRASLIRGAASIMRVLDEHFPGDGLEFE